MNWKARVGIFCSGLMLVSAIGLAHAASAFTLQQLQHLLQSAPIAAAVPFQETRESPWLDMPVHSRGTLHSSPDQLEKRVASPREETWRLLPDRMQWISGDGTRRKEILYSQAPSVGAMATALRHAVAGDFAALESSFRIEVQGSEKTWTVQLHPRDATVARALNHLELHGAGARLREIVVIEIQGERTTTRLDP